MADLTIILPVKSISGDFLNTFATIESARKYPCKLLIGVQDMSASDQAILDYLDTHPGTYLIDSSSATNLSGNLNILLRHTNTRYAMRMDGDDLMHPDRLKFFIEAAKESGAVFIGQPHQPVVGGRALKNILPCRDSLLNKMNLLFGVPFCHPAVTINLERVGGDPYDESHDFAQDYHLYVDNIRSGLFIGTEGKGTYYSVPTKGESTISDKRRIQLLSHEAAMSKAWSYAGMDDVARNQELIHKLRCAFVTNDDCRCTISKEECEELCEIRDAGICAMHLVLQGEPLK
jgi:glycosyltransferase involved in cell wall biosynthesis